MKCEHGMYAGQCPDPRCPHACKGLYWCEHEFGPLGGDKILYERVRCQWTDGHGREWFEWRRLK